MSFSRARRVLVAFALGGAGLGAFAAVSRAFSGPLPGSLEAAGVLFGLAAVWLESEDRWENWPVGLVSSAAYATLLGRDRVWGQAGISVFYFVSGLLGWYWWLRGRRGTPLPARRAAAWEIGSAAALALVGGVAMLPVFRAAADPQPALDSAATGVAAGAQFLLMRRTWETWPAWIAANALAIPLYWIGGYRATAALFVIYGLLAVRGLVRWRREITPLST